MPGLFLGWISYKNGTIWLGPGAALHGRLLDGYFGFIQQGAIILGNACKCRSNNISETKTSRADESRFEATLRPAQLAEYIGQTKVKENLRVFMKAALKRREALDHILLTGPPGVGKTTLSNIVANEMGASLKSTSGPVIEKAGDLAAILTDLEEGDVLFIDEIHRLNPAIEEILYPAMEDYNLDIMIGQGTAARSIKLELPKFTLVGATTRPGLITAPLRGRFGIIFHLDFYGIDDLQTICKRSAGILNVEIEEQGSHEIARTRTRHPTYRQSASPPCA